MRATRKKAKPGEVRVFYGRLPHESRPDTIYLWGDGASKRDASMIHVFFHAIMPSLVGNDGSVNSFLQELDARGYDRSTIEFRIKKKLVTTP